MILLKIALYFKSSRLIFSSHFLILYISFLILLVLISSGKILSIDFILLLSFISPLVLKLLKLQLVSFLDLQLFLFKCFTEW